MPINESDWQIIKTDYLEYRKLTLDDKKREDKPIHSESLRAVTLGDFHNLKQKISQATAVASWPSSTFMNWSTSPSYFANPFVLNSLLIEAIRSRPASKAEKIEFIKFLLAQPKLLKLIRTMPYTLEGRIYNDGVDFFVSYEFALTEAMRDEEILSLLIELVGYQTVTKSFLLDAVASAGNVKILPLVLKSYDSLRAENGDLAIEKFDSVIEDIRHKLNRNQEQASIFQVMLQILNSVNSEFTENPTSKTLSPQATEIILAYAVGLDEAKKMNDLIQNNQFHAAIEYINSANFKQLLESKSNQADRCAEKLSEVESSQYVIDELKYLKLNVTGDDFSRLVVLPHMLYHALGFTINGASDDDENTRVQRTNFIRVLLQDDSLKVFLKHDSYITIVEGAIVNGFIEAIDLLLAVDNGETVAKGNPLRHAISMQNIPIFKLLVSNKRVVEAEGIEKIRDSLNERKSYFETKDNAANLQQTITVLEAKKQSFSMKSQRSTPSLL